MKIEESEIGTTQCNLVVGLEKLEANQHQIRIKAIKSLRGIWNWYNTMWLVALHMKMTTQKAINTMKDKSSNPGKQ